jgi:hypothetical protein
MENEQAQELVHKWFTLSGTELKFDNSGVTQIPAYHSIIRAHNIHEAFEKTFVKWYLIAKEGAWFNEPASSCGLCNMYYDSNCYGCPIQRYTGYKYCKNTPYNDTTRKTYALEEISFLCKMARITLEVENER